MFTQPERNLPRVAGALTFQHLPGPGGGTKSVAVIFRVRRPAARMSNAFVHPEHETKQHPVNEFLTYSFTFPGNPVSIRLDHAGSY